MSSQVIDPLIFRIEVYEDSEWGATIKLNSWDHLDYLRDVFAEVFDVDYDFHAVDKVASRYLIHFNGKADIDNVRHIVAKIDSIHEKTRKLIETV
jgi:hypothetical protein